MSAAQIRAATAADVEAILALEALFPGDRMSRRSVQRFLRVPSAQVWVAEQAGQVLGDLVMLVRQGQHSARIYSVAVAPSARGQGVGAKLVRHAETAARASGRRQMRLEVRQDNVPAQALYASLGYEVIARLPEYYEDGGMGLRLARSLD